MLVADRECNAVGAGRGEFGAQAGAAFCIDGAGHALFLVPTSPEYAQKGGHRGGFVMRAIWMFLATIATPLVVSPPLLAKEKDPALTSPTPALPAAPVAEKRPHEMTLHGKTLSDPYHCLKDESYPVIDAKAVPDNVRAENAYFDAAMKPHRSEEHTSELQSLMRTSYAVF